MCLIRGLQGPAAGSQLAATAKVFPLSSASIQLDYDLGLCPRNRSSSGLVAVAAAGGWGASRSLGGSNRG